VKALGHYDAVLYSPVFASVSKPGHAPGKATRLDRLPPILSERRGAAKKTTVYALGGIKADNLSTAASLGFDGAAVLGSVWNAADPVAAFKELQEAVLSHAA
jgi:thiamine-phosphate pyrophosphorylase